MRKKGKLGLGLALFVALAGGTPSAMAQGMDPAGTDSPEMRLGDQPEESDGESEDISEVDVEAEEIDEVGVGLAEGWVHPLRRHLISGNINQEGAMGFHSIASAISPGALRFQVGLLGQASGGSNVVRFNDQNRAVGGNVVVNNSIIELFGFHARLQARNNTNSFGRPQAMLAQGDMSLGFTGRHEVSSGIWLGGDLSFFIPSGFGSVGLSASGTSVRPRLLTSLDFDQMFGDEELVIPLLAHVNIGFLIDNSENLVPEGYAIDRVERFAYGISAYNLFEFGLGVEAPLPYVTPFFAWNLGIPLSPADGICVPGSALDCASEVGPSAYPQTMSLGAKVEPLENLGLHAGIDFGLTSNDAEGLPVTVPVNFQFGLSWQIDPTSATEIEVREVETIVEVGEPRGHVAALLLDETTGEPIEEARIVYVDRMESSHLSRSETGAVRTYDFEPGEEITLEITHPRYEATSVSFIIEEGVQETEILLQPLPMETGVSGQVLGMDGLPAAGAVVMLSSQDGTTQEVAVDEEGRFTAVVTPGLVTVAAYLEGLLTAGYDRQIEPESEEVLEVVFEQEESGVVVGVAETQIRVQERLDFEVGGDRMLEQSERVLDVVAAVLLENPQIQVLQIQGHTDDTGDEDYNLELTQRRAEAVMNYLIGRGISESRLDAEGYGSSLPLVPNTSRRNRNLNRRIEFRITQSEDITESEDIAESENISE